MTSARIAPAAASATIARTSRYLEAVRAPRATAMPAAIRGATRSRIAGPNDVPTTSKIPTPASMTWSATTTEVPMAARIQAPGRRRRTTTGGTRAIAAPKKLAPSRITSPTYRSQRPTTAIGDGPVELVSTAPAAEAPPEADGAVPRPNAKEPAARWPSTAETARQATV